MPAPEPLPEARAWRTGAGRPDLAGNAFVRRSEHLLAHDGELGRRYLVERLSGIGIVR